MHTNKCTVCGTSFETKNPKRQVCPNCLYQQGAGTGAPPPRPPQGQQSQGGGHGPRPQQGGPGGGYAPRPQGSGGYRNDRQGPPGGGYRNDRGGSSGGYRGGSGSRPGGFRGGPPRGRGGPPRKKKPLLVTKEQLAEIEKRYKAALPLPNPDIHEIIGQELDISPSRVFFGINLIRTKVLKMPKLDYPKRKLAVSPDQLSAVEALYLPFCPVPPIGVHKIISKQLRMEEWRVHVAIGLIRKSRNMPRWNEDREDLPKAMKESIEKAQKEKSEGEKAEKSADPKSSEKPAAKAKPEAESASKADNNADADEKPKKASDAKKSK